MSAVSIFSNDLFLEFSAVTCSITWLGLGCPVEDRARIRTSDGILVLQSIGRGSMSKLSVFSLNIFEKLTFFHRVASNGNLRITGGKEFLFDVEEFISFMRSLRSSQKVP